MTIHERRAGRRRRERMISLVHVAHLVLFWRTLRIVMGSTQGTVSDATVFRVDRRKGKLHVTVPVWA